MTELPCPNCRQPMGTRFCTRCGEKRLGPDDHTLRHFAGHMVEAFTHADGKLFLTLRTLVAHPGQLTADYLRGRRKPFIAPLQLFLIANLIFFLLHPLIGSKTLTTDLNTHLNYTWHTATAHSMVEPRLAVRGLTLDAYAESFNAAAVTQARSFVILIVPVFSLAVMALYWRHRRFYVAHLVFALHFCTFWLLLICVTLTLTNLSVRLLRYIDVFPSARAVSASILGFTLVFMVIYLYRAGRAAFAPESAWIESAKAIALGVTFILSLQAYRFALFFITFWST